MPKQNLSVAISSQTGYSAENYLNSLGFKVIEKKSPTLLSKKADKDTFIEMSVDSNHIRIAMRTGKSKHYIVTGIVVESDIEVKWLLERTGILTALKPS